jgi:predicted nucleic acid-binding protein
MISGIQTGMKAINRHPGKGHQMKKSGKLINFLKERGISQSYDLIIGATAVSLDFSVIMYDMRDFKKIKGLYQE